jgi:hypothetical protein
LKHIQFAKALLISILNALVAKVLKLALVIHSKNEKKKPTQRMGF